MLMQMLMEMEMLMEMYIKEILHIQLNKWWWTMIMVVFKMNRVVCMNLIHYLWGIIIALNITINKTIQPILTIVVNLISIMDNIFKRFIKIQAIRIRMQILRTRSNINSNPNNLTNNHQIGIKLKINIIIGKGFSILPIGSK